TATLRRIKNCPWNSDVLLIPPAMLASTYCDLSTYHLMDVGVREIANVWNPAARDTDELKLPPNETCSLLSLAQCMVPRFTNGFFPRISIMSISPQAGHPTVPMLEPSIQNAGQMP